MSGSALDLKHIRSKYKDRMLQLAFVVSGWSPEPEGQRHGAVLALDGKYIVATGFNGPDRSWPGYKSAPMPGCGGSCCEPETVHAEPNALLNARTLGIDLSRCVMFVTKKPCAGCQAEIEAAGVQACFWLQDVGEDRGQWTR